MKIITYKHPSNLFNNSKIEAIIKDAPHFCASEVLVQGLVARYGRQQFDCISTIDNFISNLFPTWVKDTSNDVERYLEVSKFINEALEHATLEEERNILKSFKKNITGIVNTIKYLLEIEEISDSNTFSFNSNQSQIEKIFISKILDKILDIDLERWNPEWRKDIGEISVVDAIRDCRLDEVRKLRIREGEDEGKGKLEVKRNNALSWLRDIVENKTDKFDDEKKYIYESIENEKSNTKRSIIIHGLYRMKPIHFRLFKLLEDKNIGYEVIILNCYNTEYSKIYKVWADLYSKLAELYTITDFIIDEGDIEVNSHMAGKVYGNLIEGKNISSIISTTLKDECEFYEYSTTMEFINRVSQIFNETKDSSGKKNIGRMKEQFYGVNGIELNEIFRIFYPELFKKKSFMSYPLGQFIYYLHDMWKDDKLVLNHNGLLECLNMYDPKSTQIYNKLETYIGLDRHKDGMVLEEVINKIKSIKDYAKKYVKNTREYNDISHLGYIVDKYEYDNMIKTLEELDKVAKSIFDKTAVNARSYYKKLISMIDLLDENPNWRNFEKDEAKLLQEINENLLKADNKESGDNIEPNISVLKDTINFYLHGQTEKDELNWLVRDFEQIEGDLLLFYANGLKKSKAEIIHYGLISNQNMLANTTNIDLWPLKKETILNKKVIDTLNVLSENDKSYRRCMLFQGLYYIPNNIKIKMSYVRNVANLNNEEKVHDEYFMMKNIREFYNSDHCKYTKEDIKISTDIASKGSYKLKKGYSGKYTDKSIISICPYRYMYSNAVNKEAYIYNNTTFLITKFFEEYIKTRMKNNPDEKKHKWLKESELIIGDICTKKEIQDIINREYDNRKDNRFNTLYYHMPIYWVNKANNHLNEWNPNIRDKPWNNRINNNIIIKSFLEEEDNGFELEDKSEYLISEHICTYCTQKGICLYPYRLDTKHLLKK